MRLYNVDHQAAVISHDEPGVPPGEPYDFTDEQIEAGITGVWSEEDPRAGLRAEEQFKAEKDETVAQLRERVEAAGLEAPSRATKARLRELLDEHEAEAATGEPQAGTDPDEGTDNDEPASPDETDPAAPGETE